jgi:hypothetical protein
MRRANDSAKVYERSFIDLISIEQVRVIAKISKEPMEPPQGPFGAIQPADKRPALEGIRLQNEQSEFHESLFWVPPIGRSFHTHEEKPIEIAFGLNVL